jgi:hypothetical protein
MHRPATAQELRKNPRAQLRLPVRLRWQGPLGLRLETSQTIDVSREGLLVQRAEHSQGLARFWIAFPYDPSTRSSAQPETLARVVRVENQDGAGCRVALHLQLPRRDSMLPAGFERRAHSRIPFSLPIFVRPAASRWPEESMTRDISSAGANFETSHFYSLGDEVIAKIPWGEWERAGEIHGRVVRVENCGDDFSPAPLVDPESGKSAILTRVSMRWMKPENSVPPESTGSANP